MLWVRWEPLAYGLGLPLHSAIFSCMHGVSEMYLEVGGVLGGGHHDCSLPSDWHSVVETLDACTY